MNQSHAELPENLQELVETLAANLYEVRARQRLSEIRPLGRATDSDDSKSAFPPYEELPETEKQDDRNTAIETLNLLLKLGYRVEPLVRC